MTKLKLSYFGAHHENIGFSGKGKNAGENIRQQEKRKTKYEMDGCQKRSHWFKSPGAEQGFWGQNTVDVTYSQGRQ